VFKIYWKYAALEFQGVLEAGVNIVTVFTPSPHQVRIGFCQLSATCEWFTGLSAIATEATQRRRRFSSLAVHV
jgi:hypothetical protein